MIYEGRKPSMDIVSTLPINLLPLFYETAFIREARRRLRLMSQQEIEEMNFVDQRAISPEETYPIETTSNLDMTEIPPELIIQSEKSHRIMREQNEKDNDVWDAVKERKANNKKLMEVEGIDEKRINQWKEANHEISYGVPIVTFDQEWTPTAYKDYIYKLQLELLNVKLNNEHNLRELRAWKIPYGRLSYRSAYENYADDAPLLQAVLDRIKIEKINPHYKRPYFTDV